MKYDFGLVGLGVMGRNFILNVAENGFSAIGLSSKKESIEKLENDMNKIKKSKLVSIFVPTTPNPTSGFLLFVAQKDLIYLDMPVEQAVKLVISGGIVSPKQKKLTA